MTLQIIDAFLKTICVSSFFCFALLIIEKFDKTGKNDSTTLQKPAIKALLIKKIKENKKFFNCAHRGGISFGPENTVFSIQQTLLKTNVDVVEIDLRLSKDGEIVIIHDPDVIRTTNGNGLISEMTLSEIKQLDAGYKFEKKDEKGVISYPYRGKGYKVPTLEECIQIIVNTEKEHKKHPVIIFFDIKNFNAFKKSLPLIKKYQLENRIILGAVDSQINKEVLAFKQDYMPIAADEKTMVVCFILNLFGLLRFYAFKHDLYGSIVSYYKLKLTTVGIVRNINMRDKLFAMMGEELNYVESVEESMDLGVDLLFGDLPDLISKTIDDRVKKDDLK